MMAYPVHVAAEILSMRPDLGDTDGIDAIRTVLMWTPTLTAEEAIEIIDDATAEWASEKLYDAKIAASYKHARRLDGLTDLL